MEANERGQAKRLHKVARIGVVDSVSGRKTVRVVVNNLVKHSLYGKYMRRRSKLTVHDEQEQARVGDIVEVVQCRPISKRKSWRVRKVVSRGPGEEAGALGEVAER